MTLFSFLFWFFGGGGCSFKNVILILICLLVLGFGNWKVDSDNAVFVLY